MNVSQPPGGAVKVNEFKLELFPITLNYANGEQVRLEAIPPAGYVFGGWEGSASGTQNPLTLTMDCIKNVKAVFVQPGTYVLTLKVNGRGSINPSVGTYNYNEKKTVNIVAMAEKGWKFDKWSGDVTASTSSTTSVNVDSIKTITANFSQIMHSIEMKVKGQGSTVPPAGVHSFGEGTNVTISAAPAPGWRFTGWTGDVAGRQSLEASITIDKDHVYTASFARINSPAWITGGALGVIIAIGLAIGLTLKKRKA